MNDDKAFAKFLKNYRVENKLSQKEIATKLGVSSTVVSRLERGTRDPDPKIKERAEAALTPQIAPE